MNREDRKGLTGCFVIATVVPLALWLLSEYVVSDETSGTLKFACYLLLLPPIGFVLGGIGVLIDVALDKKSGMVFLICEITFTITALFAGVTICYVVFRGFMVLFSESPVTLAAFAGSAAYAIYYWLQKKEKSKDNSH